jgi:hypothetical protein
MAKDPKSNTSDGMIVTIDDEVVWDGEAEQLGVPSLVGQKSPIEKLDEDIDYPDEPDQP